ncbi:DNA cytosine methyltransferase, partial [Ursidibacter sp. B-7004-1]
VKNVTGYETLYQWRRKYVRENKNKLCPTLTANMGTGGHNVPLLNVQGLPETIRKLTPRECFNFQGYPKDFKLPNLTNSHLYKQAGNSVVVPVIKRIAENIRQVISN